MARVATFAPPTDCAGNEIPRPLVELGHEEAYIHVAVEVAFPRKDAAAMGFEAFGHDRVRLTFTLTSF